MEVSTGDDKHISTQNTEIDSPLVFQCKNCHFIVGDSFAWLSADQNLKAITLNSTSEHVKISDELKTSTDGIDLGSAYVNLLCKSCGAILGRVYKTTPRILDNIRDMFTFNLDSVKTYQLGKTGSNQSEALSNEEDLLTMPSAKALQTTLDKIKELICFLDERIGAVEEGMRALRENRRPVPPSFPESDDSDKPLTPNDRKRFRQTRPT
ncbi:uncharacterized protein VTP21DRAFT_4419 [Calcarisporiella thermophila]|uniref:uncharacterized protein n=1 Tax=Calcarisporiella thermophila TaxID=911321 RepID=UPI003742CA81